MRRRRREMMRKKEDEKKGEVEDAEEEEKEKVIKNEEQRKFRTQDMKMNVCVGWEHKQRANSITTDWFLRERTGWLSAG